MTALKIFIVILIALGMIALLGWGICALLGIAFTWKVWLALVLMKILLGFKLSIDSEDLDW